MFGSCGMVEFIGGLFFRRKILVIGMGWRDGFYF